MVIRITVEAIVYSLLYTAFMLVLFRIQGAKYQLYNYPPAIRRGLLKKGLQHRRSWMHMRKRIEYSGFRVSEYGNSILCIFYKKV